MSAGLSSSYSTGGLRQANTSDTLASLRMSGLRDLETSMPTNIGGRRSTMGTTENLTFLPNLSFADQLQSARRVLSGIPDDDSYGSFDGTDTTADFTKTHFHLLLDDDPGWKATEALFKDFLRFVLLFPGQHQVFELLRHFEELCSDQLTILHKVIERAVPGKQKFMRTVEMLRYMEGELWTWRLIRMMYEDRLNVKSTEEAMEPNAEEVESMSDLRKWQYLYDSDRNFRELRLAVKWCEQNAADLLDIRGTTNVIGEKTCLWENTLHYLKAGKSSTRHFVKHMDPDAPVRESAHLHDADEADEQRLLTLIYLHIRAGQLDKAVDLCIQSGSPWRAATLKGALPYHQDLSNGDIVGNSSRDIWKRMVWQFCENNSIPATERAIYGSLCGHISSVLPSCGSWDDALWAYTIAASEHEFHKFLINSVGEGRRMMTGLPSTDHKVERTIGEILNKLAAYDDERISGESKTLFRRLQTLVFADQPDEAVSYMHQYLTEFADTAPKHLVRLMAHVVLVFKSLGFDVEDHFANPILEHYVSMLIEDQQTDLVAFYTATLPVGLQVFWYARFLADVEGKDERTHYLSLAEKAGLDTASICITVVNNVRQAFEPSIEADQSLPIGLDADDGLDDRTLVNATVIADVPGRDMRLVNAVEWLLLDSQLHGEAICQANAIGRMLLIGHKFPAAKRLFDSMPTDIISTASDAWLIIPSENTDMENGQLSLEQQNAIREYQCHLAYLEAHETFLSWFQHYHRKPKLSTTNVMDVASSTASTFHRRAVAEMKSKQYEEELKTWKLELQNLADIASKSAFSVLLYPDGGWMVDLQSNSQGQAVDEDRREEMDLLRKRCLPLITDMVITVLQGSERYKEALQVADIVAAEETCLYQAFTKDQLKHIVQRLAKSSIHAMDNGVGCLGYD